MQKHEHSDREVMQVPMGVETVNMIHSAGQTVVNKRLRFTTLMNLTMGKFIADVGENIFMRSDEEDGEMVGIFH